MACQQSDLFISAKAKGLLLLCGMTRRFDPPAQKVKKEIEAGDLGTILNITGINRDNPYPPIEFLKHSPNIYYDCGVHDIDLALWLLGEKPVLVSSRLDTIVVLKYGITGQFTTEVEVIGQKQFSFFLILVLNMKF